MPVQEQSFLIYQQTARKMMIVKKYVTLTKHLYKEIFSKSSSVIRRKNSSMKKQYQIFLTSSLSDIPVISKTFCKGPAATIDFFTLANQMKQQQPLFQQLCMTTSSLML